MMPWKFCKTLWLLVVHSRLAINEAGNWMTRRWWNCNQSVSVNEKIDSPIIHVPLMKRQNQDHASSTESFSSSSPSSSCNHWSQWTFRRSENLMICRHWKWIKYLGLKNQVQLVDDRNPVDHRIKLIVWCKFLIPRVWGLYLKRLFVGD